jgi:hypothetical protein
VDGDTVTCTTAPPTALLRALLNSRDPEYLRETQDEQFIHEYRHFLSYPRDMRILLLTNLIYAFVLPVITFVGPTSCATRKT